MHRRLHFGYVAFASRFTVRQRHEERDGFRLVRIRFGVAAERERITSRVVPVQSGVAVGRCGQRHRRCSETIDGIPNRRRPNHLHLHRHLRHTLGRASLFVRRPQHKHGVAGDAYRQYQQGIRVASVRGTDELGEQVGVVTEQSITVSRFNLLHLDPRTTVHAGVPLGDRVLRQCVHRDRQRQSFAFAARRRVRLRHEKRLRARTVGSRNRSNVRQSVVVVPV